MCFTLAAAAMAAAGGGLSVFGQLESSKAQASAMKDEAAMIDRQIGQRQKIGAANLRDLVTRAEEDVGSSRVAAAKSGVRVGAGSAGAAERKIVEDYRRTGERYSMDLAMEEENLRYEARTLRRGAGQVRRAGAFQALGTALGTAAEVGAGGAKYHQRRKDRIDAGDQGFWDRFWT